MCNLRIWVSLGLLLLTACSGSTENLTGSASSETNPVQVGSAVETPTPTTPPAPTSTNEPVPAATPSLPPPSPTEALITATLLNQTPNNLQAGQTPGKPASAVEQPILIYQRSGGFAGLSEQWRVYADGRVLAGAGREWQVTPDQVEQLLNELEALGFFDLNDKYISANTCCDRATFELTVRRGETIKKVAALESTPNTPAALWQILKKVDAWLTSLN